jgi:hypothetical protein
VSLPWPPQLQDLKSDMRRDDDRDDATLIVVLDAAVDFVEEQRAGDFDFDGTSTTLPAPSPQLFLGTLRLAQRYFVRATTPDGLANMGELGSVRIPSSDVDIERLLGVGRFRRPLVG